MLNSVEKAVAAQAASQYARGFGFCDYDCREVAPAIVESRWSPAAEVAMLRGWRPRGEGWENRAIYVQANEDVASACGMSNDDYCRKLSREPQKIAELLQA